MTLKEHIKQIFIQSMERNFYNKSKVSRELGISIRTVRLWAKKYNITNDNYRQLTSKQRDAYSNRKYIK